MNSFAKSSACDGHCSGGKMNSFAKSSACEANAPSVTKESMSPPPFSKP